VDLRFIGMRRSKGRTGDSERQGGCCQNGARTCDMLHFNFSWFAFTAALIEPRPEL
jgi:hypothetical protein